MGIDRFIHTPVAAAGGWTRRAGAIELLIPTLANSIQVLPAAAAWTYGAYVQLIASTANDFLPHALHTFFSFNPLATGFVTAFVEIELATGAAGSETPYGYVTDCFQSNIATVGAGDFIVTGRTYPIGVTTIPAGTRIAARVRQSVATTTAIIRPDLYLAGHESPAPASDLTYPLDDYLDGDFSADPQVSPLGSTLTVPVTFYPNYAAWTQVIASAPRDLLVWGSSYTFPVTAGTQGRHFQFGIGASPDEVAFSLLGLPSRFPLAAGFQRLRRPLVVLAGERLAVRASGGGSAGSHQIFYSDL